jgi:hypothetical protein
MIPYCPPKEVSPNAPIGDRRAKAPHIKQMRTDADRCAVDAMNRWRSFGSSILLGDIEPNTATVTIWIGWGKGRHFMDGDNALAACKAFLDGIADALGVDDKQWTYPPVRQFRAEKDEPTGWVEITVETV